MNNHHIILQATCEIVTSISVENVLVNPTAFQEIHLFIRSINSIYYSEILGRVTSFQRNLVISPKAESNACRISEVFALQDIISLLD